ncbi:MAG: hypothetical protein R2709_11940 [Marmoricola sp.]
MTSRSVAMCCACLSDVFVVAAQPEDYTNRGRIITPLKDRFGLRSAPTIQMGWPMRLP